ncbi:MAG: hypothetical protein AABN95_17000 [Acidobacteriota bacterium]
MTPYIPQKIRSIFKLLLVCIMVFISAFAVMSIIRSPAAPEGFDWETYRSEGDPASGPKRGEQVDLSNLKGRNDESLADLVKESPIMLVVVDLCAVPVEKVPMR